MGQTVTKIINDSAGNPLTSFYLNACKPIGALRFLQPIFYRSKADKDAGKSPIYIKELQSLSVDINSSNYASGTIPYIAYAQCREQLKRLLGINDDAIIDDI